MLLRAGSDDSTIVRMRVKATNLDPLTAQLRLSRLLSGAQLRPSGLPRSAILFVRKLRDPLPGALQLESHDLRPPRVWEEALATQLGRMLDTAARPARGAVPSDSDAVIFLDHSELLACLARDWFESALSARWWWQSVLRKFSSSQVVAEIWRAAPEYVPAALEHLSARQRAVPFVAKLDEEYVHDIVQSVARTFALRALLPALQTRLPSVSLARIETDTGRSSVVLPDPAEATESSMSPNSIPAASTPANSIPASPWHDRVPEAHHSGLSPEQQRFLGISLLAYRAPSHARSREFARQVEAWQHEIIRRSRSLPASLLRVMPEQRDESPLDSKREFARQKRVDSVLLSQLPSVSTHDRRDNEDGDLPHDTMLQVTQGIARPATKPAVDDHISTPSAPEVVVSTSELQTESVIKTSRKFAEPSVSDHSPANDHSPAKTGCIDVNAEAESIEIETHLGGFFFLINLAQSLNLYGDFTAPAAPGIELNIWDFVTLVGAELVGPQDRADPIWTLLANLAGRGEAESAGQNFEPEDEWRVPPDWLRMFDVARSWRWNASRGRLRVLHPEGFAILDVPLTGNARGQLRREIETYGVRPELLRRAPLPKIALARSKLVRRRGVRRWLGLLMPYARARLRLALGLDSQDDLAAILCRRPARVSATDTHVDVFFGLADLPLQIRFAGLDRDPGWVPAAGRFIAFHFD